MCRIPSLFLVTEAERKHVRRRASLVAVGCFLPGRVKVLSAPLYSKTCIMSVGEPLCVCLCVCVRCRRKHTRVSYHVVRST